MPKQRKRRTRYRLKSRSVKPKRRVPFRQLKHAERFVSMKPKRRAPRKVHRSRPTVVLRVGSRYYDGAGVTAQSQHAVRFLNVKHAKRIGRRLANVLRKPVSVSS